MSLIIGVDPGSKGAFALLDSMGELLDVEDMPVVGKHVSVPLVADILGDWTHPITSSEAPIVVIEDVWSSPQMGVTSAFSFGRSKGLVEGIATMADCRVDYVTPAKWKREMKLGKDKGEARDMAMRRWPKQRDKFKRVKDDGRAEAALIALWWQVHHG
jgi:crossover junction endodeoxyribonuclease RuvC